MSPDGEDPTRLLRHSDLCSSEASPGNSLWPQPHLELLHLCKSKFKHPDFSSQSSLQPCSSTTLLHLASAPTPSTVSLPINPSSLTPKAYLFHLTLSLAPSTLSFPCPPATHTLAKPQPWINPSFLFFFFFFHSYSRAAEQYWRKSHKQKAWH